ncbi:MAG: peptide-methionine (R)-S-oxide reductase MsrB [Moraxella sp.]|nr:peptide-methionine (R)-S-oxide reductase MsrB [Moraxella sp.]
MTAFIPLDTKTINQMTEQDWQNRLTADEYRVLRQKGTERAFTGIYTDIFDEGVYRCKGCHAPLFDSDDKFHSGCGWASFDRTISDTALTETLDLSHGMRRIEVTCTHCGGHLGHVFPDGPTHTTGLRYCINSVAVCLELRSKS